MAIKKSGLLKPLKLGPDKKVVVFPGLEFTQAGNCCGAGILEEFGGVYTDYRKNTNSPSIDDFFNGERFDEISFLDNEPEKGMLILATTVANQQLAASELKRVGFGEMATWKNPNTQNMVILWGRLY